MDESQPFEFLKEMQFRVTNPPSENTPSIQKYGVFEPQANASEISLSGNLCQHCQQIDMNLLMKRDVYSFHGSSHMDSLKILDLDFIGWNSSCPLCSFFYSLGQSDDLDKRAKRLERRHPSLYVLSPGSVYGHEIESFGTMIFAVLWSFSRGANGKTHQVDSSHCFISAGSGTHGRNYRVTSAQEVQLGMIRNWLQCCDTQHHHDVVDPLCVPSLSFIDCNSRKVVKCPDTPKEYVTLSYVWGQELQPTEMEGSLLPPILPQVVEDAIKVTKGIGLRYLWVDRYCIPQDNEDQKQEQIKQMGSIYAKSTLTIIAAAGKGPNHGLPGVSSRPRTFKQRQFTLGSDRLVSLPPHVRREVEQSKWNTRGWTYQEVQLSTRQLVFTDSQVYFQCSPNSGFYENVRSKVGCSIFKRNSLQDIINDKHRPSSLDTSIKDLIHCINDYIPRDLTFDMDVLDAFWGVLQQFRNRKTAVESFLGLPLSFNSTRRSPKFFALQYALSWDMTEAERRRYAWPSWTWLGWKGRGFRNRSVVQNLMLDNKYTNYFSYDFDTISQVDMEFPETIPWIIGDKKSMMNWSEERFGEGALEILKQIYRRDYPRFLHLTAFTIPIVFRRTSEGSNSWRPASPLATWIHANRWTLCDELLMHIELLNSDNLYFSALILSSGSIVRQSRSTNSESAEDSGNGRWFECIIVRKHKEDDYFERLPSGFLHVAEPSIRFITREDSDFCCFLGEEHRKSNVKLG